MKALYHAIEEIDKLHAHLKPGETLTSTLTKFCNLRYLWEAKFAYSSDDLVTCVAEATPGDIIFVKGTKLYQPKQIASWDIRNRNQLANALRVNPGILGVEVPHNFNLKVIVDLVEIPYLLSDIESGNLVNQNIVTVSLITSDDFML